MCIIDPFPKEKNIRIVAKGADIINAAKTVAIILAILKNASRGRFCRDQECQ